MKKLALASALLAILATANVAQAYQYEVGAGVSRTDPDIGKATNDINVEATYYFESVDTKDYPLAEAAFMNRASNVSAAVTYGKDSPTTNTSVNLGGEYYLPNSDFYVGAGYSKDETKTSGVKDSIENYSAEVGMLPMPNLLVAVGVVDNSQGTDPTLRAKYVYKLGENDINLEAKASFGDADVFNVGADYYIDRTLSVGAAYTDNGNSDSFGIRARKFLTEDVSVQGTVDFGDNSDVFGVSGTYRF